MGLFSFIKNAGNRLLSLDTGKKDTEQVKESNDEDERLFKISALTAIVNASGIGIHDLKIDVDDDIVTVYGLADSLSDKEKVVLMLGNNAGIAAVDDRMTVSVSAPESDFYVVKSGDSLSKIARDFYGDMMKYPIIFEANKPMLTDPDLIYPGQLLRIPRL